MHLNIKLAILQKHAVCLIKLLLKMNTLIPFFVKAKVLPRNFLYVFEVAKLMYYAVNAKQASPNIFDVFCRAVNSPR